MSFMRFSVVFIRSSVVFGCLFVSFLPAKLLKLSGFVLILPHSFCFFSVSAPHFFLFSQNRDSYSQHSQHSPLLWKSSIWLTTFSQHLPNALTTSHNIAPSHKKMLWVVVSCCGVFTKNYPPIKLLILRAFGGKCCECCECCEPKSHFTEKPL